MSKYDVNLNNERVSFSKRIKRKILLEVAKGAKPKDVFLRYVFSSFDKITTDEKYVAKLLYKWRKELYENKEMLNFLNYDLNENILGDEIFNIGEDDDNDSVLDGIEDELKVNFEKIMYQKNVNISKNSNNNT